MFEVGLLQLLLFSNQGHVAIYETLIDETLIGFVHDFTPKAYLGGHFKMHEKARIILVRTWHFLAR